MIATGGLLRMNRRQDSLRAKNRAENKRKRKSKKKKKNDVVVVKGKLNLCSLAGLVAGIGVVVLMVGISMAVLGYWPSQSQHEYQERRRTGVYHTNKASFSKSPGGFLNLTHEHLVLDQTSRSNQSHSNSSATTSPHHCGFVCDFLGKYLYSDNLKVFGPLVMGIGIFLFICANAVLHENRDKKTKIINLRDIYSTVIDLHSIRSKEYTPLNGLVNYTQSRNPETPSGSFPPSGKLTRGSWPSTGLGPQGELGADEVFRRASLVSRPRSCSRDIQTFTDTVYSIYKDYSHSSQQAPQPRQWETTSIVTSSVNAFTLPVIKLNNCEVEESERTETEGRSQEAVVIEAHPETVGDAELLSGGSSGSCQADEVDVTKTEEPAASNSTPVASADATDPEVLLQTQPQLQWTQLFPPSPTARAATTGSRLSLNSLTDPPKLARRCSLSVTVCKQGERSGRRFSCPRLERTNSKGYIKLTDLGGDSFEAPDTDTSLVATEQEVAVDTALTAAAADAVLAAAATGERGDEAQGENNLVTPGTSMES